MKKNVKKRDDFMSFRYNRLTHKYEWVIVPLVTYVEYWSIWSKNGNKKMKKTSHYASKKVDQYGWKLLICYEVLTCVQRDRYEVIYL